MKSAPQNKYQHWDDLAAAAQRGDKRAYQTLIKELIPFARLVLSGRLASPDWVDDITQDMLISVHKALPTYEAGRSFKAWVSTILHYRKTDFLRKHYSSKTQETQSFDEIIENKLPAHVTNMDALGEYRDVEKALEAFPAKQREVFMLSKREGFSAQEIATIKNMSVSAVKVSVHRTIKRLKDILE
tara:strand:+ start:336839 stop:337396 length:558 start_codon:yes stop_codon:yes gene_type:complete